VLGGSFYLFHRLNTSWEFRYRMSKDYPTVVRGFAAATGWKPEDDARPRKRAERRRVGRVLRNMEESELRDGSERVFEKLRASPIIKNSRSVSVYLHMPKAELRTYPDTVRWLLEEEKRVFVPRVTGSERTDMQMLRVRSVQEIEAFEGGNEWGIREPSASQALQMEHALDDQADELVDLVLLPGVAFDADCRRLGHGKGYYDSFLSRLNAKRIERGLRPAVTVGIGFDEQIIDCVPTHPAFDESLDAVVTPSYTYYRESEQEDP